MQGLPRGPLPPPPCQLTHLLDWAHRAGPDWEGRRVTAFTLCPRHVRGQLIVAANPPQLLPQPSLLPRALKALNLGTGALARHFRLCIARLVRAAGQAAQSMDDSLPSSAESWSELSLDDPSWSTPEGGTRGQQVWQ